jgi:putative hydrolase of the HAD superfamily
MTLDDQAVGPRPAPPLSGNRAVRAVLFDVDDTLVDYSAAERDGARDYLAALGVPADRLAEGVATWRKLQERHFPRYLSGETGYDGQQRARAAGMIAWLGLPVPDPGGLTAWFATYRRYYEAALRAFPYVESCLAALAAGNLVLGVLTNNDETYARRKLARAGLMDRFRCVVGVDTAGCAKPEPGIFQYACDVLSLAPEQVVYVGDRADTDAAAAVAAGLHGVWLDRHVTPPDTYIGVPDGVLRVPGLEGLPSLLHPADVSGPTPTHPGLI